MSNTSPYGDEILKRLAKVVYNRIKKGKKTSGFYKFGKGPDDEIYYHVTIGGFTILDYDETTKEVGVVDRTEYTKPFEICNMIVNYEIYKCFTCKKCIVFNSFKEGIDDKNNLHVSIWDA